MTFYVGHRGHVRLNRGTNGTVDTTVDPDDTAVSLARFRFDEAWDNFFTGDRIVITTQDPRGLAFFDASVWGGIIGDTVTVFINVDASGGIRSFPTFLDAVNNNRAAELPLAIFSGSRLPIQVQLSDSTSTVLGSVQSYNIETDRAALDATVLSDKFKQMYEAGLISGSGKIDCLFSTDTSGIEEPSILMLQIIQRVQLGSAVDFALFLIDRSQTPEAASNVFYDCRAVVTRAGVQVVADALISVAIDFVTTGDIRLLVGTPSGYILQEDASSRIQIDSGLGFLLKEQGD